MSLRKESESALLGQMVQVRCTEPPPVNGIACMLFSWRQCGAGKSTLMNMIAGLDEVDEGQVVHGDTTVVGYFTQHPPPVNPRLKLIDYVGSVAEQRWGLQSC